MGKKEIDQRIHFLKRGREGPGPVLYWMSRDQRADDNWALWIAQQESLLRKRPLLVCFMLVPKFGEATKRAFHFMLEGLEETADSLRKKQIAFRCLPSLEPPETLAMLAGDLEPALIITEFDPIRLKRKWQCSMIEKVNCPVIEVDARNVVPVRLASDRREYAARTLRPKLHHRLPDFLVPFFKLKKHPHRFEEGRKADPTWSESMSCRRARDFLKCGGPVDSKYLPRAGPQAAKRCLKRFLEKKLSRYHEESNDPTRETTSGLSAYLHFGQISAQRVALEVRRHVEEHRKTVPSIKEGAEAFLEQLIVRRELSDNFCHYCPDYDSISAFPDWARKSLEKHRGDRREYEYDLETLEKGQTHEVLWNAAQREMVLTGQLHNYLRMYWAKKILEWTPSAETALRYAIELNDRYQLDGRETNGYTGIAWAIGGVHDQGWKERPIFGKVRYMNDRGAKRKFDVSAYLAGVENLEGDT